MAGPVASRVHVVEKPHEEPTVHPLMCLRVRDEFERQQLRDAWRDSHVVGLRLESAAFGQYCEEKAEQEDSAETKKNLYPVRPRRPQHSVSSAT